MGKLEKHSYSLITCCSAFVFLPGSHASLVASWSEYLAPGGVLIFDVPAPNTRLMTLFISRALAAYSLPVIGRDWITGEQVVRDVIVQAGLECKDVFLTRAYKEWSYGVGEAEVEVEEMWERLTRNPVSDVSGMGEGEGEGEGAKRGLCGW
jgi:hypothetical protein